MTITPRINFATGTKVTLFGQHMAINEVADTGYRLTNLDTGEVVCTSLAEFLDCMKLPGFAIDAAGPSTGHRLRVRLGNYASADLLPEPQRQAGKFKLALCRGMALLRDKLREERGAPELQLSNRRMDAPKNRLFVKQIAEPLFGQKIHVIMPAGGRRTNWIMPKGRTLMEAFRRYDALGQDESPLDALVALDHLKGRRDPRICLRLRELMTEAWEDVGLDTRDTTPADVRRRLETLINEENVRRGRNDLSRLIVPSGKTLTRHRESLLSPTEYLIAKEGARSARNKRGRGSSDLRALLIGEMVEIDECKISLVTSSKLSRTWEKLSDDQKSTLKEMDDEIRRRLHILVMIDVASRMPLAWIVTDQPKAEATLALFRMATRDKTREKIIYGCEGEPARGTGIGLVKNDNGTGLRNAAVKEALLGLGCTSVDVRTHSPMDKVFVERMFNTLENVLLKLIHGYTGRKPGAVPGYDATKAGVLDIDELYAILTRFMIDEYPSMRHMGTGMGGRRPAEVYKQLAEMPGQFCSLDPNWRRIHLGWEVKVTPSDEGVRVFGGLWYNSNALARPADKAKAKAKGKISVFVDPDELGLATALVPGIKDPIELQLQTTSFADLTLTEFLDLMAGYRKEHPDVAEIHEDRLARTRGKRFDDMRRIGVERKLPRSFSTFAECQTKARAVFSGARLVPAGPGTGTCPVGSVTDLSSSTHIIPLGGEVIDGVAGPPAQHDTDNLPLPRTGPAAPLPENTDAPEIGPADPAVIPKEKTSSPLPKGGRKDGRLGRPKNMRKLE